MAEVLDAVPPVMWFVCQEMRGHRGMLSVPQWRALRRISREPATSVSALAEHLSASLPTTSRIVSGLVEKGLVARESARTDRRQVELSITSQGNAVLEVARGGTQHRLEERMKTLSPPECETLVEAMSILKRYFGPAVREKGPTKARTVSY